MRHVETREAQASVLKTEVCEPTVAEAIAPSEIEEQISTQEWSPESEPVAAVTAEETSPSRTRARMGGLRTRGSAGERFGNGGLRADGG